MFFSFFSHGAGRPWKNILPQFWRKFDNVIWSYKRVCALYMSYMHHTVLQCWINFKNVNLEINQFVSFLGTFTLIGLHQIAIFYLLYSWSHFTNLTLNDFFTIQNNTCNWKIQINNNYFLWSFFLYSAGGIPLAVLRKYETLTGN